MNTINLIGEINKEKIDFLNYEGLNDKRYTSYAAIVEGIGEDKQEIREYLRIEGQGEVVDFSPVNVGDIVVFSWWDKYRGKKQYNLIVEKTDDKLCYHSEKTYLKALRFKQTNFTNI